MLSSKKTSFEISSPATNSKTLTAIDAAAEQKLQELGQRDGTANRPATADATFGEAERSIQNEWQERFTAFEEAVAAKLAALRKDIARQQEKCTQQPLSDEIAAVKTKITALVIEQEPELTVLKAEEAASRKDLDDFRARHGLERQPHYSNSAIFSIGLLMVLMLAEGGINAVLFAENNALGLVGGLLEAFMLSGANVVFATLTGYVILRNWNARQAWRKTLAFSGTVTAVALIAAFNLLAAHYRDFRSLDAQPSASLAPRENPTTPPAIIVNGKDSGVQARSRDQKPLLGKAAAGDTALSAASAETYLQEQHRRQRENAAAAERKALERFLAQPLDIQSFNGYILLFVSLCCINLAAWKGYTLDDEYPGYGRLHRRYLKAQRQFIEAKKAVLIKLNQISGSDIAKLIRKADQAEEAIVALKCLHLAFSTLRDQAVSGKADFEEGFHASLTIYREANKATRSSKAPPHFSLYPPLHSSVKLPDLSDGEVTTLQNAEAKLEKLRTTLEALVREAEEKLTFAATDKGSTQAEPAANIAALATGRVTADPSQRGNLHVVVAHGAATHG